MLKGIALSVAFLCLQTTTFGQKFSSKYSELQNQFANAASFDEAQVAYDALKKYRCMVDYYPTMAMLALQENNRKQGILFLNQALRSGYELKEMRKSDPEIYSRITTLTLDSLLNTIRHGHSISFDWIKRQELEVFFIEDKINSAKQVCDTNKRILAAPLRNLLYQYMREYGLPNDCEVGYDMQSKSIMLIFNRSYLLHDFEWIDLEKVLFNATKNYQISNELYISLVDSYLYLKRKTTRFGSLEIEDDAVYEVYLQEHHSEINQQRNQLGLPDLPTK